MKFIVSSSALFNRLQTIGRVINSKNTLPILDCFLFEIQDNILTITASDSDADYQFGTRGKRCQYPFLHQRQNHPGLHERNCGTTPFFRHQPRQHGNHGQLPKRTFQYRGTKCRRISGNESPAGRYEGPRHTGRNDAQRHKPLPVCHSR